MTVFLIPGDYVATLEQLESLPDMTVLLDWAEGESPAPYIVRNTELLGQFITTPIGLLMSFSEWVALSEGQTAQVLWFPAGPIVKVENDATISGEAGSGDAESSVADSEPALR